MNSIAIRSYDNYISAHIAMGRLSEENINGWLKDENTVTIDPILTNAVGGIKLMVPELQAERAISLLRALENDHKSLDPCPNCGSKNFELVTTPRKAGNWASAFIGFFMTGFALPVDKVNHCFDCGHEYQPASVSNE